MKALLLLCLLSASIVCRGADSYSVVAVPARYEYFAGDIQLICGAATLGCTDITGVALHTSCERSGEGWTPNASIRFAPVVHLPAYAGPEATHKLVLHELDHIRDFHRDAEAYARALSQRRFHSAGDCRAVGLEEEAAFNARMNEFGKRSVALRR